MSFRLVPKSVTLNDLERRNGHYCILRYFTEFGNFRARYAKVVEDTPILSTTEMSPKECIF